MNLSPVRTRISTLNNPGNLCTTPTNGGKNTPKISFVYNKDRVVGGGAAPVQNVIVNPVCTKSPMRIRTECENNSRIRECKENMGPAISTTPTAKIYSANNIVFQRTTSCLTPSKVNTQPTQRNPFDTSPNHTINLNRAATSYVPPTVMTPVKNGQNFFRGTSNLPPSNTSARYSHNSNDQTNSNITNHTNSTAKNGDLVDVSKRKVLTDTNQKIPSPKRSPYLPPLSPRKMRKNDTNVKSNSSFKKSNENILQSIKNVPSFIIEKQKKKEKLLQNEINEERDPKDTGRDECKCGNVNPTHSDLRQKEKYCIKCGVQKMLDGIQLKQYVSPHKSKNQIDPAALNPSLLWQEKDQQSAELSFSCPSKHNIEEVSSFLSISHIGEKKTISSKISIKQPSRQMEIQQFIKEMEEQKENLQKIQSSIENSDQQIYKFYRDQKISLKQHYEKIKSAIKLSIEEDLRQLALMEKQDLEELNQEKKLIRKDINKISQIIDKDLKGTLMLSNRSIENGDFPKSKEKTNIYKRRISANLQQSFDDEEEKMIFLPPPQSHRRNSSNISNTSSQYNQGNYHQVLKKGKLEISRLKQKYSGYSSSQLLPENKQQKINSKSFEKNSRYASEQQISSQGDKVFQKMPSFLKLPSNGNSIILSQNCGSSRSILSKKSTSDFNKLYSSSQFRMIENADMRKKRESITLEIEQRSNQDREQDISFSSNNNNIQNNQSSHINSHANSETMDPVFHQNRFYEQSLNSGSEQLEQTCTFEKKNTNINGLEQQEQEYYLHLRSGSNLQQQQGQRGGVVVKKNGVLFSFQNKHKKEQE